MKNILEVSIIISLLLGNFYLMFFLSREMIIEPSSEFSASLSGLNALTNVRHNQKEVPHLGTFIDVKNDFILNKKDFLEVNLPEKKVRIYQNGQLRKEVPILRKGSPQGWGETPAGLYKILSKNRAAFSVISKVYMPYALHIYGKYYLHGEPYYPGGKKFISEFSGGCIQLSDNNAKDIYNLAEKGLPVLIIDREEDNYQYPIGKANEFPEIPAESYLIADIDSNFIFAEKDSQKQFPIGSLTKLMTATIIAENVDLRRTILVKPGMIKNYDKRPDEELKIGERFGVVELFYPLLTASSNDAAEVLSYFLGMEKTVRVMNEKAKTILMTSTEFVDPSGLSPKNISTAQDLFRFASYVSNIRPPLLNITKGEKVLSFAKISFENLNNKNLISDDPNFLGGKTGLFVFRFPLKNNTERKIAIILLGPGNFNEKNNNLQGNNLKEEVQKIINWLKENYFKEDL